MSELDEQIQQAELGEEAKAFAESNIGKRILSLSQDEAAASMLKLTTVDPTDVKEITKLQNEIHRADSIYQWIVEMIESGDDAIDTYQTEE